MIGIKLYKQADYALALSVSFLDSLPVLMDRVRKRARHWGFRYVNLTAAEKLIQTESLASNSGCSLERKNPSFGIR